MPPARVHWLSHSPPPTQVSNALLAPSFVLGATSAAQWAQLQQAPAPYGELETSGLPGCRTDVLSRNPLETAPDCGSMRENHIEPEEKI